MADKRKQGELESEVLGCLWDRPQGLSSQQILSMLGEEVKLTTVLTVLSRLQDKGLVTKIAGTGRSFIFSATQSREEFTARHLLQLLNDMGNPTRVFSHFTAGLTPSQAQSLKSVLDGRSTGSS